MPNIRRSLPLPPPRGGGSRSPGEGREAFSPGELIYTDFPGVRVAWAAGVFDAALVHSGPRVEVRNLDADAAARLIEEVGGATRRAHGKLVWSCRVADHYEHLASVLPFMRSQRLITLSRALAEAARGGGSDVYREED